jgi:hypothetical protein
VDFGRYGANLMTYLMKGQVPLCYRSNQQFKPSIYPELTTATIILSYPSSQCITGILELAFGRKDMKSTAKQGTSGARKCSPED